ncbi:MAG: nuclear transport factor 2 family protein [Roseiarcus sp.]
MSDDETFRKQTLSIVDAYQFLMAQQRWDEWIELWAEDGTLEFPFAPAGRPKTYVGRAAILNYMRAAGGDFTIESVVSRQVHPMLDPRIVCGEMSINGRLNSTGAPYDQQYVVFFEIENGQIKRYREYWNPLVALVAYGGVEAWLASTGPVGERA